MAMMHNNLVAYYERLFAFKQYHNWNISEIEDLLPWELEVMMSLLSNHIQKVELDRKQAMANREAMMR
tara:strand:- start:200 stop:403 length:204 start_codon:yes stop_codon:yes gene_type:complete